MVLSVVVGATILTTAVAAWRCRVAWREWTRGDRIRAGLAAAALFCLLFTAAHSMARTHADVWSFIRLMPSVALTRGYSLYYPEGQGPLLGWSYGPVVPLMHLPVAVLPHPAVALAGAALLNIAALLLPLYFAIRRAMPSDPASRISAFLLLAFVYAILLHLGPSQYWLDRVQVDSFAMGFWLLGIVVLLGKGTDGRARLWTAAALFVASMFSKHNEAVLAPIPVLYWWAKQGRAAALRLALAMAALGALSLLLCIAAWGWEAIYLNLWRVPAKHPWSVAGLSGLAQAAGRFFDIGGLLIGGVAAMALLDLRFGPRGSVREMLLTRPWGLPAAAALAIFPVSLVGYIKVGGDENSFHAVYFLAAAGGMIAGRWMSADRPPGIRTALTAAASIGILSGTLLADRGREPLDQQYRDSRLMREYRFAREHPEQVWFGTNPLVTLYTDRKAYHHGYGVFDRTLPKIMPGAEQLKAYLPARMRWVQTPGYPFWQPDGLKPVAAPAGLEDSLWYEVAR